MCLNNWVQLRVIARDSGTVFTDQLDNVGRGCDNALHLVEADRQAGATGQPVTVLALVVAAFADAVNRAVRAEASVECTGRCDLKATSDPTALDLNLPNNPGFSRLRAHILNPTLGTLSSLQVDGITVG